MSENYRRFLYDETAILSRVFIIIMKDLQFYAYLFDKLKNIYKSCKNSH